MHKKSDVEKNTSLNFNRFYLSVLQIVHEWVIF